VHQHMVRVEHWLKRGGVVRKLSHFSVPATDHGAGRIVLAMACILTLLIGGVASVRADSAQYYYDPAGRLTTMVDPVNGSAQYNYDAVGNILSVLRRPITDLMVAQLSPSRGAAGTVVTIYGTGFGTTADTSVSFNGQAATPSAVSATQITVAVPSGAASGSVSVTAPSGTASSGTNFTVTPIVGLTIGGVSPSSTDQGATITISGSGFDPLPANNKIFVNGLYAGVGSASSTTLTALVPSVTSGYVSVASPNGTATTSAYLVVPPLPYLASSVGSVVNSSIGSSATSSVASAGKIGLILFDATAGQRVSMKVTASSFGSATLALYGPDGAAIGPSTGISTNTFIDVQPLARAGTYTVVIAPATGQTGSATVTLFSVPPDATATIAANATPVSLTTTAPGQNMSLAFTGTAGQRIGLLSQVDAGIAAGGCGNFLEILGPDGTTRLYSNACLGTSIFSDALVLPVTGTHTIRFSPGAMATGTATFKLYNVPPDATGTITVGGGAVSLTATVPGQNMSLTFAGTAGQRISLLAQGDAALAAGGCDNFLAILQPDGATRLYSNSCLSSSVTFSDALVLPVAGTYMIQFSPGKTAIGTATFTVNAVPPDATGTIAANGTPVSLTATVPGQNMSLTFTGTAGQRISLLAQGDAGIAAGGCGNFLDILQPDGVTRLYSNSCLSSSATFSDVLVLPVAGTYTIRFSPGGQAVGTATFAVNIVPPDVTGTIAANGTPVSLTTTVADQNMSLTFTGTAGQRVNLLLQNDAGLNDAHGCCGGCSSSLRLLQPNGTTQVYSNGCSSSGSVFTDILVLPVAGTYTIQYNPGGMLIGTATFTLNTVPPDASATVTPGGGSVSLTTTVADQNMSLTFTGTVGERVSLLLQNDAGLNDAHGCCGGCSSLLRVLQPNSTQLYSNGCSSSGSVFTDVLVLPAAGTYTIQYDPGGVLIGTATFTLYDIPPDVTGTATVGQAAANYATTVPGQAIRVSFTGTSGQSVNVTAGVVSATPSSPCYRITTLAPNGTTVVRGDQSCSAGYSSGSLILPQNGTYTVVVDPNDVAIGTFSLGVSTP
jgi:YD repeat-containing protein